MVQDKLNNGQTDISYEQLIERINEVKNALINLNVPDTVLKNITSKFEQCVTLEEDDPYPSLYDAINSRVKKWRFFHTIVKEELERAISYNILPSDFLKTMDEYVYESNLKGLKKSTQSLRSLLIDNNVPKNVVDDICNTDEKTVVLFCRSLRKKLIEAYKRSYISKEIVILFNTVCGKFLFSPDEIQDLINK